MTITELGAIGELVGGAAVVPWPSDWTACHPRSRAR